MSGHKPFSELVAKMSTKAQEKIKRGTAELLAEMEMAELRDALKIRQVQLAEQLETTQAAISRLEKDPQNTKISTLRRYVEGLGGEIEVRAVFPERSVRITNLTTREKLAQGSLTLHGHTKETSVVHVSAKTKHRRRSAAAVLVHATK
jgi:transcriptional regulator with XRE-family HTH domain